MTSSMQGVYAYINAVVCQLLLRFTPIFYMAIVRNETLQPRGLSADGQSTRANVEKSLIAESGKGGW